MPANSRGLLRFAEYAAVSASIAGAIITITTQKPAYAVAPLSVTAALNLVNRRQQSRRIDDALESTQQAIALTPKVQQLSESLEALAQKGQGQQQQLAALAEVEQQLTEQLTERLTSAIAQQDNQLIIAMQAVTALRDDIDQQRQKLAALEGDRTTDELAANELAASIAQAQTQIAQAKAQASATTQAVETAFQTTVEDFYTRTETALQQQNAYVTRTKQQADTQRAAITAQAAQLEDQIAALRGDVEGFRKELEERLRQAGSQATEKEIEEASDLETESTVSRPELGFEQVIPQLPIEENFDLDINLGIDFGTGYTKVCFRDIGRDRSEVVTFTELAMGDFNLDETLIPTRLAILQDGTLLTGLTVAEWRENKQPIHKNIDYIKMRLAAIDFRKESKEDEWRIEQIPELDDDETVQSLCAFYLSQVIVRSQQWIQKNRPELFINQTVRWSVNLGVPVEHCDSDALGTFEEVLELAWLLKSTDIDTTSLTIDSLNQLIAHLRQWKQANIADKGLDCYVTPEIAAAVWSFLNSRQAQEGFYTFFDIGDGTLDGAAFIYTQKGGGKQVDFYIGQVEPLGVSAFVEKTANELNLETDSIRRSIGSGAGNGLGDGLEDSLKDRMQQSQTRKSIQRMVANVVMEGNKTHQDVRQFSASQDIGQELKVFIGGGGGNIKFFPETIYATHSDFQQGNADIPPYKLRQIPTPDDLSVNGLEGKDFNRFAIAYGLCIPEGEGPDIRLPSQFKDVEPGSEIVDHKPDDYEDTRDLM